MITKTQFFTTADGTPHKTIELAQAHELTAFIIETEIIDEANAAGLAEKLLAKKDHIIDLLTMKASSKPKARKINGGTKKRATTAPATRPATDVPGD